MLMIDDNTSRETLLTAIYSSKDGLLDYFVDGNLDPEFMSTDDIRAHVIKWIEAGDEAEGC
jgi:hypothetical protein